MPTSARLDIPFPEEGEEPYFDKFNSMVGEIDADLFGSLLNRQMFATDGGNFTFDLTNNEVSWDSTIKIRSPWFGFYNKIPANAVNVETDWIGFVEVERLNKATVTTDLITTNKLSERDEELKNIIVVFIREGDTIYFRNGATLQADESKKIFKDVTSSTGVTGTTTTNGDVTDTLTSFAITDNRTGMVEMGISLFGDSGTNASHKFLFRATRSGNVSLGEISEMYADPAPFDSDNDYAISFSTSNENIVVDVTGISGETIDWRSRAELLDQLI